MRAFGVLFQAVLGLLLIALFWTGAATILQDPRVPMPAAILDQILLLAASDDYLRHVSASTSVLLYGLLPGIIAGVTIGLVAGVSRPLRWIVGPLVVTLAAAPLIVLMPLLVIWMGLRMELNVVIVFVMTAFPVMNAVMVALATRQGGTPRLAFVIFHGLRWGMALGATALVVSEMLGSTSGIGTFFMNAAAKQDALRIAAGMVLVVVPTVLVVAMLQAIEQQLAGAPPRGPEPGP
jgi:ABC-type nitrate/sulfonate/bicarbonate transport system permease component